MSCVKQGAAVVTATALAVVVLAASGCGKSSNTGSVSQSAASQTTTAQTGGTTASSETGPVAEESASEMKTRAERICLRLRERRNSNRAESSQEAVEIAAELAKFERKVADEFDKLHAPASLESDWKQIVAGAQTLATQTAKIGEYVASASGLSSPSAHAAIASRQGTEAHVLAIAKHDGFRECAKSI